MYIIRGIKTPDIIARLTNSIIVKLIAIILNEKNTKGAYHHW